MSKFMWEEDEVKIRHPRKTKKKEAVDMPLDKSLPANPVDRSVPKK